MNDLTKKPRLQLKTFEDGALRPVTTSLVLAECFEKQHKNVLRDIDKSLQDMPPEFGRLNFEPSSYINLQNKKQPMYMLTKEGFLYIAAGFTGKKAGRWRAAFINAFVYLEKNELARQSNMNQSLSNELAAQNRKVELINSREEDLLDKVTSLEMRLESSESGRRDHARFAGFLDLIPLFRDTHAAERSAFTLNYFLSNPYTLFGWQQLSYRQIGETLRMAYPYGVSTRVKHLIDRGYLKTNAASAGTPKYYHVDTYKMTGDICESPFMTYNEKSNASYHVNRCKARKNPYDKGGYIPRHLTTYPELTLLEEASSAVMQLNAPTRAQ